MTFYLNDLLHPRNDKAFNILTKKKHIHVRKVHRNKRKKKKDSPSMSIFGFLDYIKCKNPSKYFNKWLINYILSGIIY